MTVILSRPWASLRVLIRLSGLALTLLGIFETLWGLSALSGGVIGGPAGGVWMVESGAAVAALRYWPVMFSSVIRSSVWIVSVNRSKSNSVLLMNSVSGTGSFAFPVARPVSSRWDPASTRQSG